MIFAFLFPLFIYNGDVATRLEECILGIASAFHLSYPCWPCEGVETHTFNHLGYISLSLLPVSVNHQ